MFSDFTRRFFDGRYKLSLFENGNITGDIFPWNARFNLDHFCSFGLIFQAPVRLSDLVFLPFFVHLFFLICASGMLFRILEIAFPQGSRGGSAALFIAVEILTYQVGVKEFIRSAILDH